MTATSSPAEPPESTLAAVLAADFAHRASVYEAHPEHDEDRYLDGFSTAMRVAEKIARAAEPTAHVAELEAALAAAGARLRAVAADLYRDHTMPPRKDSRSYPYRMGWWDGVYHAADVVRRAALATPPQPAP